jgi:5,5'-dehydrodivanillate O-demethylase
MSKRYEDFDSIGPGTLAGRFLRSFWQPIYLAGDVPEGRPIPVRMLGENFTLYRGTSGHLHLVGPKCVHRGLALSTARIEGDCLRCFYHGWLYDENGQCRQQPAESRDFAHTIKIPSYPVREYLGMVFAFLGEGQPPEFPTYEIFEGHDGFIELKLLHRPWPYFTQIENSIDETHFNFAHQNSKFAEIGMNANIPELTYEETEYGFIRLGKRGNVVRRSHVIMPNCNLTALYERDAGWVEHITWRVPIDDATHVCFTADFVHKTGAAAESYLRERAEKKKKQAALEPALSVIERVVRGELHADQVPGDRLDIVFIQDGVACMGQGKTRNRDDDVLGLSDRHVELMRRIWTRELGAIRDGKPLTPWRIPRNLAGTRGVLETQ